LSHDEILKLAADLKDKMYKAYLDDTKANQLKQPALNKLNILQEVCRELKKISLQRAFLDLRDGCSVLAYWLEPLPDGTYPNIMIAREILNTLNTLELEADDLSDTPELKKIVRIYSSGETGIKGEV